MDIDPANPPAPEDKDWKEERVVTTVPRPDRYHKVLEEGKLWDSKGLPDLDVLKEHLLSEGFLSEDDAITLLKKAEDLFGEEPNVLKLDDPVTIVGDIHGQFFDMMKMFQITGDPEKHQYLFLGDYVDRGHWGSEVGLFLMGCKVRCPKTFFMLRGNHETKQLTGYFGFQDECESKYSPNVYNAFIDCFSKLPVASVVGGSFFCVHAGLSPKLSLVSEIEEYDRVAADIPPSNPIFDLMWSDPMEEEEEEENPFDKWIPNEKRRGSFSFSSAAACEFLTNNKLVSIIRAHEPPEEGYFLFKDTSMDKDRPQPSFPPVITVFSAPNYCDSYGNKAAVIRIKDKLMNIRQFHSVPHPYLLPDRMNAFDWSLMFIAEKVTSLLVSIWNICSDNSGAGFSRIDAMKSLAANLEKISSDAKIRAEFGALATQGVDLEQLKEMKNSGGGLGSYSGVSKLDAKNEAMPDLPP